MPALWTVEHDARHRGGLTISAAAPAKLGFVRPGTGTPWLTAALDLLFPALCPVCDARLATDRRDPLCGRCWASIARIGDRCCPRCGIPGPAAAGEIAGCHGCSGASLAFDGARSAAIYQGTVREALHALKFRGKSALARPLGDLVVEECGPAMAGETITLVPVPLARERERERGYNQAQLLARRIGVALAVPVEPRWLRRVRSTVPQSDLTAAQRRANVRGAFAATRAVAGRHVVVVDDVFTTGATLEECARALRAAGAARVSVLTVARVP